MDLLRGALDYFDQHREEIAAEVTTLVGKPITQSRNELNGFFERAEFLLGSAEKTLVPEMLPELPGFHRRIEHVPHGVVFIIAAWNYPLMIALNGVLAALLAGNTSSSSTPVPPLRSATASKRPSAQSIPTPGILRHVLPVHDECIRLIRERQVDHVILTGSLEAGRAVSRACGDALLDCHLELGGKDAAYVAADADPRSAAESIVDGCMYNAGQSCCGIERVFVHADLFEQFVAHARELAAAYRLGDPNDEETTMGPLADPAAADLMGAQIEEARLAGAEIALGGNRRLIGQATFFEPTIVLNPAPDTTIMREENFGPIMPVVNVQDDQDALTRINDCELGLTAALFTSSLERANSLAARIEAGTVFLNRCDYLDPALPWTGHKLSGRGSALSTYAFHGMTRRKSIHFRLPAG